MTEPPSLAGVAALAPHAGPPLVVVDVGCRWGPADVWTAFGQHVVVYGFDPDAAECERLQSEAGEPRVRRFIPRALGPSDQGATLHLTVEPACSSLYPPDPEVVRDRPALACATEVGTQPVELTSLDSWAAEARVSPDFIKLDTQGSELGVLRGAEGALASVRAVEAEVEFNPIYSGQPLFGDVDAFLRDRGFVLWRLKNLVHYGLPGGPAEVTVPDDHYFDSVPCHVEGGGGQLFWANAFYVREGMVRRRPTGDWRGLIRDACVTAALGFGDLAARSLESALLAAPPEMVARLQSTLGSL